jgi:hypothetical protein
MLAAPVNAVAALDEARIRPLAALLTAFDPLLAHEVCEHVQARVGDWQRADAHGERVGSYRVLAAALAEATPGLGAAD